ncbi:hypothetical protein [Duganella callida]|uniref:Uncharacterized protein n=1 Tax=Duganella callida TaxID=2561932 RepID=A0A4Y9S0R5_9BURK|nr:hypothetical protein [Duganella callida]TFW14970.1 hypothetical protein E4L98_27240 [Duganella callida]
MSFDDENLHVTSHRQIAALALLCIFLSLFFLWPASSTWHGLPVPYELALSPGDGFYVLVETLLTSMKLIIALLLQEVKRYVFMSLILFRKAMILKIKAASSLRFC